MSDTKEIIARAVGIVERLAAHTPIEKFEILAIARTIVEVEIARAGREANSSFALKAQQQAREWPVVGPVPTDEIQ